MSLKNDTDGILKLARAYESRASHYADQGDETAQEIAAMCRVWAAETRELLMLMPEVDSEARWTSYN